MRSGWPACPKTMMVGSFDARGHGKMPVQSGSWQSTRPSQSLSIMSPHAALVFSGVGEQIVLLVVVVVATVVVVDNGSVELVVVATVELVVAMLEVVVTTLEVVVTTLEVVVLIDELVV